MSEMTDHPHALDPNESEFLNACPLCGSFSGTTLAQPPALLAVCDVLVVRALEAVGKRVVRADRSRFSRLKPRPWHVAHTLWQPDGDMADRALKGAWDVVPAMIDNHGFCWVTSVQVVDMLDSYVRDLLLTGRSHNLDDLKYRFESRLGLILDSGRPYSPGE